MAIFEYAGSRIHYTDSDAGAGRGRSSNGAGARPALLLFAPGGMKSAADLWANAPFDPRRALGDRFRVIAMDQRNAGASTAPIAADHGWQTYTDDHVALLDHLGIERVAVLGMCIGGPFSLGLMARVPERVLAAVLLQPIGLDGNRDAFLAMFDDWAKALRPQRSDVPADAWAGLCGNLFGGDFVFSVSRDFVRSCRTPMLIARGDDRYHPASVSEEVAALAPDAELISDWKAPPARDAAVERIRSFLDRRAQA